MSELKRELFGPSEPDPDTGTVDDRRRLDGAPATAIDEAIDVDRDPGTAEVSGSRLRRLSRRRTKKRKRRLTLAVLPTMLTLGNAVCGLAAIAIASSDTLGWPDEQKLFAAGALIFAGMLFDALDGSAARLTGQASDFGAELDSLCDAITFGTAPAVIIWRINDVLPQRLTWAIGALFTLCVLIRLARFNVETKEDDTHQGFDGLPSPAAAGTLAAFAIAMPDLADFAKDDSYPVLVNSFADWLLEASHYFIPALALTLAYLMVSRFQYPHIVQQWVRGRRAPHQIGQALFTVVGVFLLHWVALPLVFCYFAFAAPVKAWLGHKSAAADSSPEKDPA